MVVLSRHFPNRVSGNMGLMGVHNYSPLLARTLSITIEELIGVSPKSSNSKRGPAPKLQQQLEQLSRLPKAKQRLVSQVIESVLAQADR